MRDTPPVQRNRLPGLRARTDVDLLETVEGLQRHLGAERGRGHRNGHRAVQIVPAPLERGVRQLVDLDVEVTGRTATGPDLALARELDPRAVVDTGGDLDGQRATRPDPPVTGALGAGSRDDGPEALALRTRPGGHDLPEEGPRDLGHLTPPATHVT